MISMGREWLHRVESGHSPRRIKVTGLRRISGKIRKTVVQSN
jgi:hypothetical protein